MYRAWLCRLFFAVVAAMAAAGIVGGTACTRWGQPGPITPTLEPISSIFVDPRNGSDSSGNGTQAKPYKTFTKAVTVLTTAKTLSTSGVTINLASGDYVAANGEKFPIVIPTNVTIQGTNFGTGFKSGSFIDGVGEDTIFERVTHSAPHTAYATLEIVPPANVNLNDVYVGASTIRLPSSQAGYVSFDLLGVADVSSSSFGAGIMSKLRNVEGVLVASGTLTCSSCQIHANGFGIGALTVPLPTTSPSTGLPSITLTHPSGDSSIAAKVVDIITDGSASVTASGQRFGLARFAFEDSLTPIVAVPLRGPIDFGGGAGNSSGGNDFIGARTTEISITRRAETVDALDDTWNPNEQGATRNGLYKNVVTFGAGKAGKNVTVARGAVGSTVIVGPAAVPTPTPSTSPSGSPTSTPT